MTTKEFYEKTGGNYEEALLRFMQKEELIKRFSGKFLQDTYFDELCNAMEQQDLEQAFKACHTLKGVAANLGYGNLYMALAELTEALRNKEEEKSNILFQKAAEEYRKTVSIVQEYVSANA